MFEQITRTLFNFWSDSGFGQVTSGNVLMIAVGILFIFLAVRKGFEPLLLVPIGFGIILGNVPYNTRTTPVGAMDGPINPSQLAYYASEPFRFADRQFTTWERLPNGPIGEAAVIDGKAIMVHETARYRWSSPVSEPTIIETGNQGIRILAGIPEKQADGRIILVTPTDVDSFPVIVSADQQNPWKASPLWFISRGVDWDFFPPLIFLGLGAMTDFGPLLANPRTIILGAAAQFGIFGAIIGAVLLGFSGPAAASIGIIGGADGPTAIYTCNKLAPELLGAVALSAYSYMAMVPLIQPPIMRWLTTPAERKIRMPRPRDASPLLRIMFPIVGFLLCGFLANAALPLLGCLFFGNLLRECGVTERLSKTAQTTFIDILTIMLGLSVGAKTQASTFLTWDTIAIFMLGMFSFALATASGVLMAKFMNLFLREPINPLIGSAGVSAVPMAARVSQTVAQREDPQNFILMHAMGPNVAGVIGTALASGILLSFYG